MLLLCECADNWALLRLHSSDWPQWIWQVQPHGCHQLRVGRENGTATRFPERAAVLQQRRYDHAGQATQGLREAGVSDQGGRGGDLLPRDNAIRDLRGRHVSVTVPPQ